MDCYATLEVPKDAKPEDVKRAYHKRAMQAHPDRGGSKQEMSQVSRAYQILGHPERRKHYDETGEDAGPEPDNVRQKLIATLSQAFHAVLMALPNQDPNKQDLAKMMAQVLKKGLRDYSDQKSNIERGQVILKEALGRFQDKEGLIALMIQGQLTIMGQAIEKIESQEQASKDALAYLKGCKFNAKQRESGII